MNAGRIESYADAVMLSLHLVAFLLHVPELMDHRANEDAGWRFLSRPVDAHEAEWARTAR